jgi:DNA mismatch repair protein MutS
MGDFFELFHDDAKVASQALGLTLTARDREKIPMAGVPVRAVEGTCGGSSAATKVALCDQMEDPATAKGLVDRAVVGSSPRGR